MDVNVLYVSFQLERQSSKKGNLMIPLTLEALMQHLQKNHYDPKIQKETGQIYFIMKQDAAELPVFIRIYENRNLLQILAFICNVKAEMLNDMARLLHLFNKELDMPGFGLDEAMPMTFYRLMIPVSNQAIDPFFFNEYLKSVELATKLFLHPIVAVASGTLSYQEFMKKVKEKGGAK
jgi:hypothetical protein